MAANLNDNDLVKDLLTSVPHYIEKIVDHINPFETRQFCCAVTTCPNKFVTYESHLKAPFKFHNFPKDAKIADRWLEACGLKNTRSSLVGKILRVCSDHFDLNDYIRNYKEEIFNPNFKRCLFSEAVPHLKLPKFSAKSDPNDESKLKIISWSQNPFIHKKQGAAKPLKKILIRVESDESEDVKVNHIQSDESEEAIVNLVQSDESEEAKVNYNSDSDTDVELTELKEKKQQLTSDITALKQKLWDLKQRTLKQRKKKPIPGVYRLVKDGIFTRAQLMYLLGRKRVIWSDDDFAAAFNLRHTAGKPAYLYFKNELRWPLPSLRSVQIWAASD